MQKTAIRYHRISVEKSGGLNSLSIQSQDDITNSYCSNSNLEIVGTFQEVESGTIGDDRPQLAKAIELARKTGSLLVFSRIDRLARNAEFLLRLQSSGVEIVFCDMPDVRDRFTLGILALVAEQEARSISTRTKIALAKAKANGVVLGNPRLNEARETASKVNREGKIEFAKRMLPIIEEIRNAGVKTLDKIASCLTARGIKTRNGGNWYGKTVSNVLTAV